MVLIQRWLTGTKYFVTGRILYNKYGSDDALKKLLERGETPFARQALEKALAEIAAASPVNAVPQSDNASDTPVLPAGAEVAQSREQSAEDNSDRLHDDDDDSFVVPRDPLILATMMETLGRNIRRNKQKAACNPDNTLYPALVKKYSNRLNKILSPQ